MPFLLQRGDITTMAVDAVVNAANERLAPGGGVCGAIFEAAGPAAMDRACRAIGHCPTGGAVATPGFDLPATYVIHAVGPIWQGGHAQERQKLMGAYTSALEVAEGLGAQTVAFPLISSGIYGVPQDIALAAAKDAIAAYLRRTGDAMTVTLVLFPGSEGTIRRHLPPGLAHYLASNGFSGDTSQTLVDAARAAAPPTAASVAPATLGPDDTGALFSLAEEDVEAASAPSAATPPSMARPLVASPPAAAPPPLAQSAPTVPSSLAPQSLEDYLAGLDEGFSTTLLGLIDRSGLKDSEVYHRANVSRQHFSKIRSNPAYRPKKSTVLAFCIALGLDFRDSRALLEQAGYAFNPSSVADTIVRWFIDQGGFSIMDVNEALYAYDQPLLGA